MSARLRIAAVDFADQVGAGEVEHLGAVFLVPIVALDIEGERLNACAHAAVAEQDTVAQGFEQREFGHDVS
jgi:hypothetical protein